MTTPTLAAKIAAIAQEFDHEVQRVRGRNELTADAKQQRIAALYLERRAQVRALRQRQAASDVERVRTLRRELFAAPIGASDALLARDARDRVRAIADRDELVLMLREAEDVNDLSLSRAIAERGLRDRDELLLNVYLEFHPRQEAALQELLDRTHPDTGHNALGQEIAFDLAAPGELGGANDYDIERLAAGRADAVAS